jgi:ABC-2 type transport system permease protein
MNQLQFFSQIGVLSWTMQRNELPMKVFLSTFAVRIIFQVLFFVWIARIIGGEEWMLFALYGNILLPAIQFLFVDIYNVIREEIDQQRIDLLTCSSSSLLSIIVGRTVGYIGKTLLVILFTYVTIGWFVLSGYEHWWSFVQAVPILLVITFSAYSVAVFFSAFNMSSKIGHNAPNVTALILMLLGNFTIPVQALPTFMQYISAFLPLRHAVDAFRLFMVEQVPYWTNADFYLEMLVSLVYVTVGYGVYLYSIKKARRDSIQF